MTALDAFLYGMPLVLMAGAGVTLWFAKRAAADIRSRDALKDAPKRRTFRASSIRARRSPATATAEKPRVQVH